MSMTQDQIIRGLWQEFYQKAEQCKLDRSDTWTIERIEAPEGHVAEIVIGPMHSGKARGRIIMLREGSNHTYLFESGAAGPIRDVRREVEKITNQLWLVDELRKKHGVRNKSTYQRP